MTAAFDKPEPTDRPLANRISCRAAAIGRMGRFGVGRRLRERMVDGAVEALEAEESRISEMVGGRQDIMDKFLWDQAAVEIFAIGGARTQATGIFGWIALQIFIRVALPLIVEWWLNRRGQS